MNEDYLKYFQQAEDNGGLLYIRSEKGKLIALRSRIHRAREKDRKVGSPLQGDGTPDPNYGKSIWDPYAISLSQDAKGWYLRIYLFEPADGFKTSPTL
jgi:hypothetical protein